MEIQSTIASVVGNATDTKWGQVLHTPHAYGVVEVFSADGIARQKGIQALSRLSDLLDTKPVSLRALEDFADEVMSEDVVSLVVVVPVGAMVYLVCRGKGGVYIKRGDMLSRLVTDQQSLSGNVKTGDTIIAASHSFVSVLSDTEILGVFDHLNPEEVAEKLTLLLHEYKKGDGGAAFIFHIDALLGVEELVSPQETSVSSSQTPIYRTHEANERTKQTSHIVEAVRYRFKRLLPRIRAFVRTMSWKKSIPMIIISLFVISIIFGLTQQQSKKHTSRTLEIVNEAQHAFDEGVALSDINPVKGRERLAQAKLLLTPLVVQSPKTSEEKTAKVLYDQVVDEVTRALHITREEPQLYFDVSLIKSNAIISDSFLFEDVYGLLDSKGKTVYSMKVAAKNGAIVGGGEAFSDATLIAGNSDTMYVFTSKGIHAVRLSDQKTTASVIKPASEWGSIRDMSQYGGNVYLLDSAKSRIWKYIATDTSLPAGRQGFTDIREYLNPDTLPDLSTATNMAIDGSVWLGTSKGDILRFTQGKENVYQPQGAEPALGKNLQVYVSDDVKMVYILDSDHHRVVVFDKDGLYLSQYVWESAFVPTQISVSEKLAKIFFLSAGKLYSIDIK
jgi:hypothetical protein